MANDEHCDLCGKFVEEGAGWCSECWAKEVAFATNCPNPFICSIRMPCGHEEKVGGAKE